MKRTTPTPAPSFVGGWRRRLGALTGPARAMTTGAAATAAALALATTLASCGGPDTNGLESTPAADLGDRVVEAFRDADSVHVVGVIETAGRAGSSYDLRLAGESTTGTIVRDGHEHEIVKVGADTYVRGDAEYWKSVGEATAADLLGGSWVRLSSTESELYRYFTLEGLALAVAQYTESLDDPVTQAKLDDTDVVTAAAPDGSTLWAANTGSAYPLRLQMSGSDTGVLEFSEYDAELVVTAPPDAIDLARLG